MIFWFFHLYDSTDTTSIRRIPIFRKVRCLLGYKQQDYHMVEIPVIMPKPDLMALTGGYRKTPVLQLGADIFCDTAAICRVIDHLFPDNSIYPSPKTPADCCRSLDRHLLFKLAVAVAFSLKPLPTANYSVTRKRQPRSWQIEQL